MIRYFSPNICTYDADSGAYVHIIQDVGSLFVHIQGELEEAIQKADAIATDYLISGALPPDFVREDDLIIITHQSSQPYKDNDCNQWEATHYRVNKLREVKRRIAYALSHPREFQASLSLGFRGGER